ncbi:MAG TPA: dodecin domain-containing protein [Deltaproteobacteria bacterium]|nr:dodecin domain-containing protein [Deltaproteobacteria bacterium]
MPEHVYEVIEIVGSSKTNIEDAVQNALNRAAQTHESIRWFQIVETRGYVENGKVAYWQVNLKIGSTIKN